MDNHNQDIQKALSDVTLFRRVLDQTDQGSTNPFFSKVTLDANLLLQACALFVTLALISIELLHGHTLSKVMILESQIPEMRLYGITIIGLMLLGLITILYYILWCASRHSGETFECYVRRNFKYVQNLSFISDLLMKFFALSLVILSGHAQWVAPLLMAFTGDYLLQGRFFTLSLRVSVCLGLFCILGAISQFMLGDGLLIWSLALFSFVTALSIGWLAVKYRQQQMALA